MAGGASWAPELVIGGAKPPAPPRSPIPPAMKAAITRFRITLSMDRQQNHREFAVARQGGVVLVRTAVNEKKFIAGREICIAICIKVGHATRLGGRNLSSGRRVGRTSIHLMPALYRNRINSG